MIKATNKQQEQKVLYLLEYLFYCILFFLFGLYYSLVISFLDDRKMLFLKSDTDQTKKTEYNRKDILIGIGLFYCIVCLWLLSWYLIDKFIISDNPTSSNQIVRGVFGDKFGAINALFSGLAFAG